MSRYCRSCALGGRCKGRVGGVGPPDADLMCVGQAPGWYEDRHGVPFIHDAGQFLSNTLEAVGIPAAEVYYTNAVKCYPGRKGKGDAAPPTWATQACWPQLEAEIATIQPRLIIAVGTVAMNAFGVSGGIHVNGGKAFETQWGLIIPILHPAGLMRRMADVPKFHTQLRGVSARLRGGYKAPPVFSDVEAI